MNSPCGLWSVAFYSSKFGKSSLLQFSSYLAPILFNSLKLYMAALEFRAHCSMENFVDEESSLYFVSPILCK